MTPEPKSWNEAAAEYEVPAREPTPAEAVQAVKDARAEASTDPDPHWDDAVEWLINSRHLDLDARDAFWMLSQGLCTEDEADQGAMADGTTIRHARASRSGQ